MALARMLARQDELAADDQSCPVAGSTIFQRDDVVVRMVDLRIPVDSDPRLSLGVRGPRKTEVLRRLIDTDVAGGLSNDREIAHFLERSDMALITDRRAPGA